MRWNNYHYFHPIHFVYVEVEGTREECLEAFEAQKKVFPQMVFGTCIHESDFSDPENSFILIRRFVSARTCATHCTFPPTYKREGRTIE